MNLSRLSKYIFIAILFSFCSSLSLAQKTKEQDNFYLDGIFSGNTSNAIVLSYIDSKGVGHNDKCAIVNNRFHFSGNIGEPTLAFLKADISSGSDEDSNSTDIFIEPKNMELTVQENHFKSLKMSGSKTQEEYMSVKKSYADNVRQLALLDSQMNMLNDSARALKKRGASTINIQNERLALAAEIDSLRDQSRNNNPSFRKIDLSFITQHPYSYLSPYLLYWQFRSKGLDKDSLLKYYRQLSSNVQRSYWGNHLKKWIIINKILSVNSIFPDKQVFNTRGNEENLSSLLNGDYTLIIFWASWCAPCRQLTPEYKKIYSTYYNKGLNFVAITLDDTKSDWLAAIKQDQTAMWKHVSLKMKSEISVGVGTLEEWQTEYGLNGIPAEILLKGQTIIAKYRGASDNDADISELENKLKEIYQK